MKVVHQSDNTDILVCVKGEEVIESLIDYVKRENIRAGHLTGLGGAESLEIAFYNLSTKEYEVKKTNYDVEILSLTGNVSMRDGEPVLHMHGVFGKRDFSTFGGHVFKMVTGGTCEIHLTRLGGIMKREYDQDTELHLLCEL